jgi:putative ABC transport system substrate-binding protein
VIEAGAPSFGVQVSGLPVRDTHEIERGINAFANDPNGGLIVLASALTVARRELIVSLAARSRLPAVYPFRFFATAGGLYCGLHGLTGASGTCTIHCACHHH